MLLAFQIGAMRAPDVEEVLGVLARRMRDNPVRVASFGEDLQDMWDDSPREKALRDALTRCLRER